MLLKNTIDKFLRENVSSNSYEIYRGKIYVFYKFLIDKKQISDSSYSSYLSAMKIDEILESLDFYIKDNSINSQSSAWHYISVVKRYFSFLYDSGIKNSQLIESFSISDTNCESFQYKISKYINENDTLDQKVDKQEITLDDAKIINAECDQRIEEYLDNKVFEYNKYRIKYNNLLSCIIIKLILLTGAAYRIIKSIKYIDRNINNNTLCINDYTIHIPNNLSGQINSYLEIREKILKNNNKSSDKLFITAEGNELSIRNIMIHDQLEEIIGRGDVTGIIKFVIMEMITKGVNQNIIQSFTGVGSKIYNDCQDKVNKSKAISASRYLDSKVRSLEIFDIM